MISFSFILAEGGKITYQDHSHLCLNIKVNHVTCDLDLTPGLVNLEGPAEIFCRRDDVLHLKVLITFPLSGSVSKRSKKR